MRNYVAKCRGFEGFKERFAFSQQLRRWEIACMRVQVEFKKLEDQANYSKVEPMYYALWLFLAIIFSFNSFSWIVSNIVYIIKFFINNNED